MLQIFSLCAIAGIGIALIYLYAFLSVKRPKMFHPYWMELIYCLIALSGMLLFTLPLYKLFLVSNPWAMYFYANTAFVACVGIMLSCIQDIRTYKDWPIKYRVICKFTGWVATAIFATGLSFIVHLFNGSH